MVSRIVGSRFWKWLKPSTTVPYALKIPLNDIKQATNNFAYENIIDKGAFGVVYKGELSEQILAFKRLTNVVGLQKSDFYDEVMFRSTMKHENIISLVGFCDEDDEMILVLEHGTKGSLDMYLSSPRLTWWDRVGICFDIARGLEYLQDDPRKIVLGDLKSGSIQLGEDWWQAKIGLSKSFMKNVQPSWFNTFSNLGYVDPLYMETGRVTKETDIYSFGVILFEVLCGRQATTKDEDKGWFLSKLACHHYENGSLTEIIDPILRLDMDQVSLNILSALAYRCLNMDPSIRPTAPMVVQELREFFKPKFMVAQMAADIGVIVAHAGADIGEYAHEQMMADDIGEIVAYAGADIGEYAHEQMMADDIGEYAHEEMMADDIGEYAHAQMMADDIGEVRYIDHMRIPLTEIGLATCKADLFHFDVQRFVAERIHWEVPTAELSEYPRRKSTVFVKSLDRRFGQRTEELLGALRYVLHENVVKILGFCDEDDERILVVYEYASNGSLDEFVRRNDTRNSFPWVMRLQICLDAARGLKFLHNGGRKHKRIIHGNIKSSNILINRDGVAMIGDFGLSTNEYNDPPNHNRLTKEYDVYSFGLVLFEVMSGMLTHFKISKDDPQYLPEIVKRGFEQRKLDEIIDPRLKKEFEKARSVAIISERTGTESIKKFARVAYQCFQEQPEDRPTMDVIEKELTEALKYHVDSLNERQEDEDNSMMDNLEHLKIPFKEIYSATRGFDDNHMIGAGGFGGVYTAELFHIDVRKYAEIKKSQLESSLIELSGYPRRKGKVALKRLESTYGQGRREFLKEIDVLSGLYHQNLISLVGFCYEYGEMILVYDYASNGSFDRFIANTQDNLNLNWAQRLQICIDAAQGLNYLHVHHIIHRDVKSPNILLGGSLEGIIGDVGLSITINTADSQPKLNPVGTLGYIDPKYFTRGILTKQSDMYSFGVVLLEVLCGRFARPFVRGKDRASLVDMAEHHLTDNQPYQIMAQYLMKEAEEEKFKDSVKTYAAITRECLHSTETHCLTMADVVKQLNRALTIRLIGVENISLEEIMSATNCFSDERVIGKGPSGKIYKGELLRFKRYIPVAVKRLDKVGSYGEGALLKEVVKLYHYSHENIITIRGFCEEDNEKIIIMDHASNESLDKHLDKPILTWGIRLKISIGAAKGLNHIHSFEEDQKTLHGNIQSSNILLDHDWEATISNFIISKSHGTLGYLDPQSYSGMTKKSDVYSFGVVLFEILSGKLAIEKDEKYSHHTLRQIINDERERYGGDGAEDKKSVFLAWMAARCFEENKLEALIFDDLMEQTDAKSIDVVSKVAYQCLNKDQEKRPTMALVIQELEKALNIHEEWECEQKLPKDYERIMKMIEHPESQKITKKDLYSRLSSGTRLNNEKVWLSLSKDGKVKELISATLFSYESCWSFGLKVLENSRFGTVAKISNTQNLKIPIEIKTQFLSLGIIYGAYLVFKFCDPKMVSCKPYVDLKYKTASGELNSYIAEHRDGEWMMIELCRFRSDDQTIDFKVQLESFCGHPCGNGPIFIDGIEFRPIDNAAHEESVDTSINSDSSINWDQQLSSDLQEIMTRSENDVPTTTKEELHKLLSTGVLIDNGEKLFSLGKVNCKKCHMLPAKAVIHKSPDAKFTKCPSSTMSRFEEVIELQRHQAFSIKCDIETKMLSPETTYPCYLVFQLPENSEGLRCPVKARDLLNKNNKESTIIYLKAPEPVDLYRDKRVPDRREDGWMEVRVWEFVYNHEIKDIPMELKLACLGGTMSGLTVCGIEFRPL